MITFAQLDNALNKADYAGLFALYDKMGLSGEEATTHARFCAMFMSGKYDWDFSQQLRAFNEKIAKPKPTPAPTTTVIAQVDAYIATQNYEGVFILVGRYDEAHTSPLGSYRASYHQLKNEYQGGFANQTFHGRLSLLFSNGDLRKRLGDISCAPAQPAVVQPTVVQVAYAPREDKREVADLSQDAMAMQVKVARVQVNAAKKQWETTKSETEYTSLYTKVQTYIDFVKDADAKLRKLKQHVAEAFGLKVADIESEEMLFPFDAGVKIQMFGTLATQTTYVETVQNGVGKYYAALDEVLSFFEKSVAEMQGDIANTGAEENANALRNFKAFANLVRDKPLEAYEAYKDLQLQMKMIHAALVNSDKQAEFKEFQVAIEAAFDAIPPKAVYRNNSFAINLKQTAIISRYLDSVRNQL
jgi:hypothetical protein